MDKFEIRKEIADLINSIKEHSDNIGDNKHIPQLELELILNKIKKLYEKSIVYTYLNTIPEKAESEKISILNEKKETTPQAEPTRPVPPIDLFGSELPPASVKPKQEKKIEKKEEKKEEKTIPLVNVPKNSISDIKSTIGINDQFQFANELFEGSIQEYSIAIQQLNTAGSLESAIDYYTSLQQLYNWDENNETAKRLLELVDRRYT